MSEAETEAAVDPKANPAGTSAEDAKTEQGKGKTEDAPQSVPYDRFQGVNERMKAAETENAQMKADQAKIREEKLKAEGKTAELLEDTKKLLEIATKDSEKLNAYESSRRESLLSDLKEESREIYKDMPLDALEKHVKAVREANPDNGGMASSAEASSSEEAAQPKSRKTMTQKELIADGANRRNAFIKKYGGVTVDQLRHPTRIPG